MHTCKQWPVVQAGQPKFRLTEAMDVGMAHFGSTCNELGLCSRVAQARDARAQRTAGGAQRTDVLWDC